MSPLVDDLLFILNENNTDLDYDVLLEEGLSKRKLNDYLWMLCVPEKDRKVSNQDIILELEKNGVIHNRIIIDGKNIEKEKLKDVDLFDLLIKKGADVTYREKPLRQACIYGREDMLERILRSSNNLTFPEYFLTFDQIIPGIKKQLQEYAEKNPSSIVKKDNKPEDNKPEDNKPEDTEQPTEINLFPLFGEGRTFNYVSKL